MIRLLEIYVKQLSHFFKVTEFGNIKNHAGENAFVLTAQGWVEKTNAIGIISKSGKNGGTYTHQDIAFKFASWLSTEFEFYIIKEFQRLKTEEQKEIEWSAKRELAKINYRIHTDAIKENIVPTLTEKQKTFVYANEADLLNVALFGKTAGEWKNKNPVCFDITSLTIDKIKAIYYKLNLVISNMYHKYATKDKSTPQTMITHK